MLVNMVDFLLGFIIAWLVLIIWYLITTHRR